MDISIRDEEFPPNFCAFVLSFIKPFTVKSSNDITLMAPFISQGNSVYKYLTCLQCRFYLHLTPVTPTIFVKIITINC